MISIVGSLRYFSRIKNGTTPASGKAEYWGGNVFWATPEDLGKLTSDRILATKRQVTAKAVAEANLSVLPVGSIIISTRAPIGHMAINDKPMSFNQGCRGIIPGDKIYGPFLYYLLSSRVPELNAVSNGTTFVELSRDELAAVRVIFPELDSQRRIADFLDERTTRVDGLIAKKTRLLELLAEQRQALITRAVTKGLDPSAPMKPSGIELTKRGDRFQEEVEGGGDMIFITGALRHFGRIQNGTTPASGETKYWDGDVLWATPEDLGKLTSDRIAATKRQVTEKAVEEVNLSVLPIGSIIISTRAPIGHMAMNDIPMSFNQGCRGIIPGDKIHGPFLYYYLQSRVSELNAVSNGTTFVELSRDELAAVRMVFPDLDRQKRIAAFLDKQTARIDHTVTKVQASIGLLQEYRAALITAAVTGKIETLLPAVVTQPAARQAPAAFKRAVLAAYIADRMCDQATFGKVKFQKTLHLAEEHLGIDEVEGQYYRKAAGPFDPGMMRSVHSQLKKRGWITAEEREGKKGTKYRRGAKINAYKTYFDRYFGDKKEAIDGLLTLIGRMDTQQAEIVSTSFAAWNDLLIEGKNPSDDEIVHLIWNDWNKSKRNIARKRWYDALSWMRSKDIVPQKRGKHTKKKAKK